MRAALRLWPAPVAVLLGYLLLWPVGLSPVAWTPSADPGFTGAFAANDRLASPELLPLAGYEGPEDLAIGPEGRLFVSVHRPGGGARDGAVLVFERGATNPRVLAKTEGRPLGLDVAEDGTVWAADAVVGLVRIAPDGTVQRVATSIETRNRVERGRKALETLFLDRLVYPNDVAIGPDGTVYVSDSTQRFAPKDHGGTLPASILDIAEHQATGRVIAIDPTGATKPQPLVEGFSFANGLAVSQDGAWLAVVETAEYRVWRVWLTPERRGEREILIEGLPGFPDNIEPDGRGGFWIGLTSPRRGVVDALAPWPVLRSMLFRLPSALRPGPAAYGAVIRIGGDGAVRETWQDPSGAYPTTSGALVADDHLYVASLTAGRLARYPYVTRSFAEARR